MDSELGRVRGLGSAESGVHHWWRQRMTAAGNLLLVTWFFASLVTLPSLSHATVVAWIGQPLVATALIVMLANLFWHLRLGLQVVIDDYAHEAGSRIALIVLINFYAIGAAAIAIFSVARIALAGSAA